MLQRKGYFGAIAMFVLSLYSFHVRAQDIDTVSTFSIGGYIDAYYAYYTDSVGPGNYQKFPTTSPRSNSPGLNIAQLSVMYTGKKVRGAAVLHYGDLPNTIWTAPFSAVQEAHLGFKVVDHFWIDGGFFRSHFGTEMLTPAENIASSVTVSMYHEPYYESGLRFNVDITPRALLSAYLLNGYGVFIDNNNKKSGGMVVAYTVNEDIAFGYSNYIGDDSPPGDTAGHMRIAQNAWFNYQAGKIRLQVGGDVMMQQNADIKTGKENAMMFSALTALKYQCSEKIAVYGRGEIFNDANGFLSGIRPDKTGKLTGYKIIGMTIGGECKPTPESYVKLEGRMLQADKDQEIFYNGGSATNVRFEIMINAGVTFDLLKRFGVKIAE